LPVNESTFFRYIAEYKLGGSVNRTSFMGQKECNLSDDFTMGIGLLPTHWSLYLKAFIYLPFYTWNGK